MSAEKTSAPMLLMTSITISARTRHRSTLLSVHLVRLVTLERKKVVKPTVTTGTLKPLAVTIGATAGAHIRACGTAGCADASLMIHLF